MDEPPLSLVSSAVRGMDYILCYKLVTRFLPTTENVGGKTVPRERMEGPKRDSHVQYSFPLNISPEPQFSA